MKDETSKRPDQSIFIFNMPEVLHKRILEAEIAHWKRMSRVAKGKRYKQGKLKDGRKRSKPNIV